MKTSHLRTIACSALVLGLQACAAESQGQQDEFLDDSPISLADQGPEASDSARDLFAENHRVVGSSFAEVSQSSFDFVEAGDLSHRVVFEFSGGTVVPGDEGLTARGRAFLRVDTSHASTPSIMRSQIAFDERNVSYRMEGTTFVADVNGHRITVRSPTEIHVDWAEGAPSEFFQYASDFAGVSARPTFGDFARVEVSGRLWNSLDLEPYRSGYNGRNSFRKFVSGGGLAIRCDAQRVLGAFVQKECNVQLTGPQIEQENGNRLLRVEVRGTEAQTIWNALGGDEEYRGFSADNAAVGCRSERGAIRCIAQAAAR